MTILELLRFVPFLQEIPTLQVSKLANSAEILQTKRGNIVNASMMPVRGFFYILDGVLCAQIARGANRYNLSPPYISGQWADLPASIAGISKRSTLVAMSNSQVIHFPHELMRSILDLNPTLATHFAELIALESLAFRRLVYTFTEGKIETQVMALLGYLQENIYHSNPFTLTFSRTVLAHMLGTSRETVSRAFTHLREAARLEVENRRITILDRPIVIAEESPPAKRRRGERLRQ